MKKMFFGIGKTKPQPRGQRTQSAQSDKYRFFYQVYKGDFSGLEAVVKEHPECLLSQDRAGNTLLIWAVLHNRFDVVKYIIKSCKKCIRIPSYVEVTPLMFAVSTHIPMQIIRALVEMDPCCIFQPVRCLGQENYKSKSFSIIELANRRGYQDAVNYLSSVKNTIHQSASPCQAPETLERVGAEQGLQIDPPGLF